MSVFLLTGCSSNDFDTSDYELGLIFKDVLNNYIKYNIICEALNKNGTQVSGWNTAR